MLDRIGEGCEQRQHRRVETDGDLQIERLDGQAEDGKGNGSHQSHEGGANEEIGRAKVDAENARMHNTPSKP